MRGTKRKYVPAHAYCSWKRILFNLRAEERSLSPYVRAGGVTSRILAHAVIIGVYVRNAELSDGNKTTGELSMRKIRKAR